MILVSLFLWFMIHAILYFRFINSNVERRDDDERCRGEWSVSVLRIRRIYSQRVHLCVRTLWVGIDGLSVLFLRERRRGMLKNKLPEWGVFYGRTDNRKPPLGGGFGGVDACGIACIKESFPALRGECYTRRFFAEGDCPQPKKHPLVVVHPHSISVMEMVYGHSLFIKNCPPSIGGGT